MSSYHDGRRVEYAVCHDLADNGYRVTRAASSKGFADVIAIKPGQILLVNVKRTRMPGRLERLDLLMDAGFVDGGGGVPLVALGPASKLTYRRLTGPGPADWEPWTPDEIGRPA
jgi:Holliday junction resolvase